MGTEAPLGRRMPAKSSYFHLAPLHKLLYTAARTAQDAGTFCSRAGWTRRSIPEVKSGREVWKRRRVACVRPRWPSMPEPSMLEMMLEGEKNNY
jgi:hypothetical protein